MKKMVTVGIVAMLAALFAVSPALAAIEVEGDAYVGIYDKYLWRGVDFSDSMPVAQGGVDLSAGNFTLSYWTNVQLRNDGGLTAGDATENDIVLDYSFSPTEMISVSIGDIFYMLEGAEDTHEVYLSVGLDTILEPAFTVYYDWDEADENGLFYTVSIGHGFDVNDSLSVSLGALASYNDESDYGFGAVASDWHNLELSLGADYALTDQISVSASFLYSEPLSDEAEDVVGIDDEVLAGLSVAFTF